MPFTATITQAMDEGAALLVTAVRVLGDERRQLVQITVPHADLQGLSPAQRRALVVDRLRAAFRPPTQPAQMANLLGDVTIPD